METPGPGEEYFEWDFSRAGGGGCKREEYVQDSELLQINWYGSAFPFTQVNIKQVMKGISMCDAPSISMDTVPLTYVSFVEVSRAL